MGKLKLHNTLEGELQVLLQENPEDRQLAGCLRALAATTAALGLTIDIRNTAAYASATLAYERVSGRAWTGRQ